MTSMRAVRCNGAGGPDVLEVVELPRPVPASGEVIIDVRAAGINRADLLQRQGHYPPPAGASELLGLECAGIVSSVGADVDRWHPGDQVCALLAGGGYAEQVAVPAGQVAPLPDGIDIITGAALPEAAATAWSNLFMLAGLRPGETLLVHGGAGGIGTVAIQLGVATAARVFASAGSAAKLEVCRKLGAAVSINYREQDFVEVVREVTDDRGADVILDNMGAAYLARNLDALAVSGRLVVIGLQGGARAELDLGLLMRKRAAVLAATLRSRPSPEKAAIMASVVEHVWPLVADGTVRPVVHATFDLDDVRDAHRALEDGGHVGKVLLRM